MNYYNIAKQLGHTVNLVDLSKYEFDPVLRYGYRKHISNEKYINKCAATLKR